MTPVIKNGTTSVLAPECLKQSNLAQEFTGVNVPENTRASSKYSFKLFGQFVLALVLHPGQEEQYSSMAYRVLDKNTSVPEETEIERSICRILLCSEPPSQSLGEDGERKLNHFLIEFGTCYVSERKKREVEPSSMMVYAYGVQRRLHELGLPVNLFKGPIFGNLQTGVVPALDNKFSRQQASGAGTKSHNILTLGDIKSIFESVHCNPFTAVGF